MTNRFANRSLAELHLDEWEMREEHKALLAEIEKRERKACGIQIGKVYKIIAGRFEGRMMLVLGISLNPMVT